MMEMKSSTTGKIRGKGIKFIRRTECSTLSKLPSNMDSKDNERPQPIKIAQFLEQSKQPKSTHKSSVRKKILPERLGTLSSIKKTDTNKKLYGTSTCIKSVHSDNHVRRNLNFNEITNSSSKKSNENINKLTCNKNKSIPKKNIKSRSKKSLLLPPNTIKNKYLKKENDSPETSTVSKEIDKISTDSAVKKESKTMKMKNVPSLHDESIGVDVLTTVTPARIKRTKFSIFSEDTSPRRVISKNHLLTQNNSMHKKCIPNKPNLQDEMCTKSRQEDCIENYCSNLQDTQLEAVKNDGDTGNGLSETICIKKDTIIRLEHDLKDLLRENEKNVLRIKSMLTRVSGLLSINDEKIAFSNGDTRKKCTMANKEVEIGTSCKSMENAEEKLRMPITCIPEISIMDSEFIDKIKFPEKEEEDKENIECINRRISDISFMELENKLNITYAKPVEEYCSKLKTPVIPRCKQKRSLREYMALKSTVSFLETPDGKKFRSLCQINDIDKFDLDATYISNKLLTDLNNLYSDSPESTL